MSRMSFASGVVAMLPLLLPVLSHAADAFVESDFKWDDLTQLHKNTVIVAVNKLARENPACAVIDPQSVQYDFANSNPDVPAFTVQCGEGDHKTTVQFTSLDAGG